MPPRQENTSEGIETFQLPKALVTRIAKSNLPSETKLQKDTVNALVDSATVFINFLAATAHEVANSKSRKTITGPDILQALELVDLSDLVPLLENELDLYRSVGKGDRSKASAPVVKGKGKEKEAPSATPPRDKEGSTRSDAISQEELEEEEGDQEDQETLRKEVEEDEDVIEEDNVEQEEEEPEEEEPEELVDTMAIEEEELRRVDRGLEEINGNEE